MLQSPGNSLTLRDGINIFILRRLVPQVAPGVPLERLILGNLREPLRKNHIEMKARDWLFCMCWVRVVASAYEDSSENQPKQTSISDR